MEIIHNTQKKRFEVTQDNKTAYLEYGFYKGKNIALLHMVVPDALSGKGIAPALTEYAFDYAEKNDKWVMMYCTYVAGYVKKHPELKKQLNPELYR